MDNENKNVECIITKKDLRREKRRLIFPLISYFICQLIASSMVMVILYFNIYGGNIDVISSPNFDINSFLFNTPYLLLSTITASTLTIIHFFIFNFKKDFKNNKLKLPKKLDYAKFLLYGISFNVIIQTIVSMFSSLVSFDENNQSINALFSNSSFFPAFLTCAILAPMAEEYIFRNLTMKSKYYGIRARASGKCVNDKVKCGEKLIPIEKYNAEMNTVFQAILFGIMHGNLVQTIYTAILGYIFAKQNIKNNSYIPSLLMHIGLNAYATIQSFYPILSLPLTTIGFIGTYFIFVEALSDIGGNPIEK